MKDIGRIGFQRPVEPKRQVMNKKMSIFVD